MSLPSPILDNRSYQQLRDELVRRIPVYAPEWTDHNASDPGVTLLELFAFLGENLLFRFNQIPEATLLAYLRLLQIPVRPAVAARAVITMTCDNPAGLLVPLGTEVKAGNLPFETRTEVKVYPLSMLAVARAAAATPDAAAEPEAFEFAVRALDAIGPLAADQEAVFYENKIVPADGNGLPVDFEATVDGTVWIAVLKGKTADLALMGDAALNIGFVPDPVLPALEEVDACPGAGAGAPEPAVEWQVSTGDLDLDGAPKYRSLTLIGDTTRGLTQEGVVRLRLPKDSTKVGNPAGVGTFAVPDADAKGTGQFPPVLDDKTEEKLLFWIRGFRLDESRVGKVQFVGANAVEVTQTVKSTAEFLGTGTGQPNQVYKLVHTPVIEGSLVVEVEDDAGRFQPWKQVDGFHASQPDDWHFMVDADAGVAQFGTGLQGYAPQIGRRIRAAEYRYGGGGAGNVTAKAINRLTAVPVKEVQNPLRAQGGADKETIDAALTRIPAELRRRDRAVTSGDFEDLALATPGARVGRANCLPLFYPPTKSSPRAGVVSVVVWPKEDAKNPNAPLPDRNLLREVCSWLDKRRLVTTELYVIPPVYRKIAVSVGLQAKPGYGIEAVRQWVELVVRQYLAPLPPYGPSGGGWPLGRRVHGPELEAAALQVEGVEFLEGLNVARLNEAGDWIPGSVNLAPYEVPELAEISVVAGPPRTAGDPILPPDSEKVAVPIPVIREEC